MERKGSGFGKIINGYDVPQNVPQNVPQGVLQDNLDVQILELIRKNNRTSTERIATALGVSSKTINYSRFPISIIMD